MSFHSFDYRNENWRDYEDDRRDDEERPARRHRYSCSDGFCGASDCSRCHPGTCDQEEQENQEEKGGLTVKIVTARKPRAVDTPNEIKPGDKVQVTSWFTYQVKGARTGYVHTYERIAKGPTWNN